ncbi:MULTISPECIES: subclass B1 metallo-beta-lactamase [Chryseobacterium]|uniref:beta-lactamase n=1 Tax=Chryseobacterium camelliae TaxID=1265445 RepID=A0ABU0TI99_9FLAO|nr:MULTISPECIES: subclass B1 metallo-beta-lactamase [Chryseobacterium]MDT3409373.1 metallo-beta-lactamase class B [Pseudacidovorax intermedius]MDQ1096762.1 metallo-beta-lactamase class B [Chryseobacterium camelliae]MDQ1100705.1 metallo-beta-lactamase class B [Chryseobacterium sp. SORGH_AS_1048]MDR6088044.1 metallo-beta-lactamase class B [Chryseobacterium sp. SORGH_AS_0909]MDR6132418.1 metallo-beta-lactamase class B [Chryseobacterium sp. SORGH_AS_1175]
MKSIFNALAIILFLWLQSGCHPQKNQVFKPSVIYRSDHLVITQISKNTFEHTSFLQTDDFGNVPCNGLMVRNGKEIVIFDTPVHDKDSEELIRWVQEKLHCSITAIVPTHFHNDCLGGLQAFHNHKIPSYAYTETIRLARKNHYTVPEHAFSDSLRLKVGQGYATARFFGEGHTRDNVVGYFPEENIMFGGCLIKEMDADKGYLGDSNTSEWSATVEKVKKQYPNVKIVIPGHGDYGDQRLLDYTILLFKNK